MFSLLDSSIRFDRLFREQNGYAVTQKDGNLILKVNVLGFSQDELDVSVEPMFNSRSQAVIKVQGDKYDDVFEKDMSINNRFYLANYPKKLDAKVENGYLTITIGYSEPVELPKLEVNWYK